MPKLLDLIHRRRHNRLPAHLYVYIVRWLVKQSFAEAASDLQSDSQRGTSMSPAGKLCTSGCAQYHLHLESHSGGKVAMCSIFAEILCPTEPMETQLDLCSPFAASYDIDPAYCKELRLPWRCRTCRKKSKGSEGKTGEWDIQLKLLLETECWQLQCKH